MSLVSAWREVSWTPASLHGAGRDRRGRAARRWTVNQHSLRRRTRNAYARALDLHIAESSSLASHGLQEADRAEAKFFPVALNKFPAAANRAVARTAGPPFHAFTSLARLLITPTHDHPA
jgi:hypothetical protein